MRSPRASRSWRRGNRRAALVEKRARRAHVVGGADEGERHVVDAVRDAEGADPRGPSPSGRERRRGSREADSLVRRERAARDHRQRMSPPAASSTSSSISPSQRSSRSPARTNRGREASLTETSRASPGTPRAVSVKGAPGASNAEPPAISPIRSLMPARSWRIATGRPALSAIARTAPITARVLGVAAVREVQPRDVHPGSREPRERFGRSGRRADGADDLGARHEGTG